MAAVSLVVLFEAAAAARDVSIYHFSSRIRLQTTKNITA
jgi:hypothetical protein